MKAMRRLQWSTIGAGALMLGWICMASAPAFTEELRIAVDSDALTRWREWVPDSAWVSRLERLAGGPPPEWVLGGSEMIAGVDRGRLICLSFGLRGSNWFSGSGGRWILAVDGSETTVGELDWTREDRTRDRAGQWVSEIWRYTRTGDVIRLTWRLDPAVSALDCEAEAVDASRRVRLIWEAAVQPEAPFPAIWSGMFRGGMETARIPIPGVSDTFLAAAAWLPNAAARAGWAELDSPSPEDLMRYLRADRFDRLIPGKVLGWRIGAGGQPHVQPAGTGFRVWFGGAGLRFRVIFPAGSGGSIRYAMGADAAEILRACMIRQTGSETAGVLSAGAAGSASSEGDTLEAATDPESGITVLHLGAGHFFRVTRPDWAWIAAREWLRRQRPDRAAAQLEPFLNRFSKVFLPDTVPLNVPALVNVSGEPVLPRVFDSFGDTAMTILAAADLLKDLPQPVRDEVLLRWQTCLDQAVWSLYWQSDPAEGTPPPGFHPARMEFIQSETDWITALAVLGAMDDLYREPDRAMPSEWREWRRTLEIRVRFHLREMGEKQAWPVRPMVVLQLYRHPEWVNLPDRMRFNAAGVVFPQRFIRSVVPDVLDALREESFHGRETTFSAHYPRVIRRN